MISEITFAKSYTFFWKEYLPWLNDFITFINKGQLERKYPQLISSDEPIHRSMNNVIAFELFRNTCQYNNSDLLKAYSLAKTIVEKYPRNGLESFELTNTYKEIIESQTERLLEIYKSKALVFAPKFDGCGILHTCEGDMMYENTLVEIKAGERNLLPSDIKQLLIYCSLNWLNKTTTVIHSIEVFNPRQGILWKSSVSDLIESVSNVPKEDLYDQLTKYLYNASEEILM